MKIIFHTISVTVSASKPSTKEIFDKIILGKSLKSEIETLAKEPDIVKQLESYITKSLESDGGKTLAKTKGVSRIYNDITKANRKIKQILKDAIVNTLMAYISSVSDLTEEIALVFDDANDLAGDLPLTRHFKEQLKEQQRYLRKAEITKQATKK